MFTSFEYLLTGGTPILLHVSIENRSTTLKSLQLSRKPRNVQSLQTSSFIRGLRIFSICPLLLITVKLPLSQLDGLSAIYITR